MGKERKRRVLILTVTAGNGHNACARAMAGGGVRELAAHILAQPFAGYGEQPDFSRLRERVETAMKQALRGELAAKNKRS